MVEDGKTIRVGLIGYGYAGKTFHAPLVRSVAGLQLTIVGSSKRDTVLADLPGVVVCSNGSVATLGADRLLHAGR
jgi:predicted dehydrogenase